jgi:hypothetical protein
MFSSESAYAQPPPFGKQKLIGGRPLTILTATTGSSILGSKIGNFEVRRTE